MSLAFCAFRHETLPPDSLIIIESNGATASICIHCLTLITTHRRIHHMKIEQLIPKMAGTRDKA